MKLRVIGGADDVITSGQHDDNRTNGISCKRVEVWSFPFEISMALKTLSHCHAHVMPKLFVISNSIGSEICVAYHQRFAHNEFPGSMSNLLRL